VVSGLLEDLFDGEALASLNGGVKIDERPAESAGQALAHRGLAAAHEAQ
jgi:hypothetical protein